MSTRRKNKKSHALLTDFQVVQIYMFRSKDSQFGKRTTMKAAQIAELYGVCEKAIRDIWSRRTWKDETKHLDQIGIAAVDESIYRPVGLKASLPKKPTAKVTHQGHRKQTIPRPPACKPKGLEVKSIDDELFLWELKSSFPLVDTTVFVQEDDL